MAPVSGSHRQYVDKPGEIWYANRVKYGGKFNITHNCSGANAGNVPFALRYPVAEIKQGEI